MTQPQPSLPDLGPAALVVGPILVSFELPGKPPHKARHRSRIVFPKAGKPFIHNYPDPETEAHEKALAELAALYMRRKPPSINPVVMVVHAFRPIPVSWSKRDQEAALAGAIVPTSKPDADNYLKLAKDALNGIVYADDSQVIDARCIKKYSDQPALRIEVRELIPAKSSFSP